MPKCHSILHAVKKSTRQWKVKEWKTQLLDLMAYHTQFMELTTLGRERVLPWYKGKGSEVEVYIVTFLVNFLTACKKLWRLCGVGEASDSKTPKVYYYLRKVMHDNHHCSGDPIPGRNPRGRRTIRNKDFRKEIYLIRFQTHWQIGMQCM